MRPRAAAPAGRPQLDGRTDGRLAEVARGGLLNLVGAAVAGLDTVTLTVIIARTFSKAAAGAFFTSMSLFLIVEAVASLGAATGTVYFIARLRSLGQHQRIPEVMRTATRPVAVVSVTAAVILFLLADPVARLLVDGQLGHAGATPAVVTGELRALAIALPFAVMLDVLLGASRGYRVMGPTVMVDKIGRPGLQLAGIGVAAFAGSAALLAPLWALPYVPALSSTLNMDYTWHAFGAFAGFLGGSWNYSGSRYTDFSSSTTVIESHVKLPSYNTLRMQAGLDNGHYSVEIFGSNLTNARGITEYANSGGQNETGIAALIQPRTIGLELGAKF